MPSFIWDHLFTQVRREGLEMETSTAKFIGHLDDQRCHCGCLPSGGSSFLLVCFTTRSSHQSMTQSSLLHRLSVAHNQLLFFRNRVLSFILSSCTECVISRSPFIMCSSPCCLHTQTQTPLGWEKIDCYCNSFSLYLFYFFFPHPRLPL